MKCPKCHNEMKDNCCMRCGYMNNGNYVTCIDKEPKNKDMYIYNKNFEAMYRNENVIIPMIFGGLYLAYVGHIISGILLIIIDFFLWYFTNLFLSCIPIIGQLYIPNQIIYIVVTRMIFGAIINPYALWLDRRKVDRIKKKYPTCYEKKLIRHHHSILYVVMLFEIVVIGIIIIARLNIIS